jgi:hypothetical protein
LKLDYASDAIVLLFLTVNINIEAIDTYAHLIGSVTLAVGAVAKLCFDIYIRYKETRHDSARSKGR